MALCLSALSFDDGYFYLPLHYNAMMNATFLIIIMMVRIAAFLWTLGIISHIVPNAFATKIVQSNTSPKSASNQIPTTSTPLYSLNAAIGIGSRMDFVMMFAIFLNLVMMVGIVVGLH